jgi:hypothetical protein
MRLLFSLCLFIFISSQSFSQVVIRAHVKDSILNTSLEGANGTLKLINDSLIGAKATTDFQGNMVFTNVKPGNYYLIISNLGFKSFNLSLRVNQKDIDLGDIVLKYSPIALKEVVVRPPIRIKMDTIEYDAGSFKVRQGAKTEELLKKLPGLSVGRESQVNSRGKTIQSVLVNGEKFFGDDLKIAIQNIPAELIDKIQVYESKSEQSKYTGIDDGNRVSTINIVTKKFKSKTYFGDLEGGVSPSGIHNLAGNINTLGQGLNYNVFGQDNTR